MKFKALIAGVLGSFAISTAALAADVIIIPPPAPPPPVAFAPAGYDWSGLYAGGQVFFVVTGGGGGLFAYGGQVGFNLVRGNLVFGGDVGAITGPGGGFAATVFGKVGVALGATDRILAYGTVGTLLGAGGFPILFGGGVAFGLGEKLSVFGEALAVGGCCLVRAGVNFHFGN